MDRFLQKIIHKIHVEFQQCSSLIKPTPNYFELLNTNLNIKTFWWHHPCWRTPSNFHSIPAILRFPTKLKNMLWYRTPPSQVLVLKPRTLKDGSNATAIHLFSNTDGKINTFTYDYFPAISTAGLNSYQRIHKTSNVETDASESTETISLTKEEKRDLSLDETCAHKGFTNCFQVDLITLSPMNQIYIVPFVTFIRPILSHTSLLMTVWNLARKSALIRWRQAPLTRHSMQRVFPDTKTINMLTFGWTATQAAYISP